VFARLQDAAATGVIGSVVSQTSDKQDMNVQDVIRADHAKVNTLFTQMGLLTILKIQEYFGQIYKDLMVHSKLKSKSSIQQYGLSMVKMTPRNCMTSKLN